MRAFSYIGPITAAVWLAATSAIPAADYHDGLAAYDRGDYETALGEWRALAEQGDRESQYRVARMYYHGEVTRDDAEAARWYARAAEQGHLQAQNNLGLLYEEGRGIEQDPREAVAWYRRAAEQGLSVAQANLGRMYDLGSGVDADPANAARWYQRAAEQGHAGSQYRLAVLCEEGLGVSRDLDKAAKWYRKAAKQDHARAQAAIGSMYADGRGVSRDPEKATTWLGRASAQGVLVDAPEPAIEAEVSIEVAANPPSPATPVEPSETEPDPLAGFVELREIGRHADEGEVDAQYRLAQMYATGDGAPQSLEDSARWYLVAAEQGHAMAGYKVALLYLRGRGFPRKDYVQAYRWFSLSAERGIGDAAAWRDKIRVKMSDDEILAAERFLNGSPESEE